MIAVRKNFDKTVEDNGERFRFIIEDGNCFVVSSKRIFSTEVN